MAEKKETSVRFGLLTVFVWLLVAGGVIFLLWQVINRISESNLPLSTPTPNLTQVYQTKSSVLTAQPSTPATSEHRTSTATFTPTQTQSNPIASPHVTSTAGRITLTATPAPLCDQAAAGNPIDITIPDDSLISPGQSFIKTWKLMNAGTCTWTTSYSTNFFYGDRMGAPEIVPLQENVPPAQSVEISVEMEAPLVPGTYQGNWKLANPAGALFGIGPNGDSPFWVRIIVIQALTATSTSTSGPTGTSTPTSEVTSSPTPEGQLSGELSPKPGDSIDLDRLILNGSNADLDYQVDANQYHWLAPHEEAMIGVFGSQIPTLVDCQAASMSQAPIAVESLSINTYLCYRTVVGRFGRMQFMALEPNSYVLTLDLLTWASP